VTMSPRAERGRASCLKKMLPSHPGYGLRTATRDDWWWGHGNNSFVLTTTNVYMSSWSRLERALGSPSKVVIMLYHYGIDGMKVPHG
jgi:hypothetical protein